LKLSILDPVLKSYKTGYFYLIFSDVNDPIFIVPLSANSTYNSKHPEKYEYKWAMGNIQEMA
jgi:hypothetical protein